MKKIFFLMLLLFFSCIRVCHAFDWKDLHEKARAIRLKQETEPLGELSSAAERNYLLGLVSLNAYENERAKEAFDAVLKDEKDSIAAKWGIAEVLRREHRIEESEELLDEVISRDESFAPAQITLAYIKYLQMDFGEAARLSARVINMGKEKVDLANMVRAHGLYAGSKGMLAHYGSAWTKLTHFHAIRRHLKMAEKLDPNAPEVLLGWGSYYMLMPAIVGQNLDKAKELFLKAIENNPRLPDSYVRLAQVHKKNGDFVAYEENINKALEIDPRNELALDIYMGVCKFICLKDVK